MAENKLRQPADPLYQLLRESQADEFNRKRNPAEPFDLHACNLRGVDLRGCNVDNVDFTDAYFRQADLRGVDLRKCRLEGASLHGAHVSGAYFPESIEAGEIEMSVRLGTRLRARKRQESLP
jgi:uncharacterized protein YjbI with pentapeptide repeats